MKKFKFTIVLTSLPLLFGACAGSSGLSGLAPGQDVGLLHATRGQPQNQLTDAQVQQMGKQIKVVKDELELDDVKADHMVRAGQRWLNFGQQLYRTAAPFLR